MLKENVSIKVTPNLYVYLIWLFVLVITFLLLLLCYAFLTMRRAEYRESQSLAFSHLVISALEKERQRISWELHDRVLPFVYDKTGSRSRFDLEIL